MFDDLSSPISEAASIVSMLSSLNSEQLDTSDKRKKSNLHSNAHLHKSLSCLDLGRPQDDPSVVSWQERRVTDALHKSMMLSFSKIDTSSLWEDFGEDEIKESGNDEQVAFPAVPSADAWDDEDATPTNQRGNLKLTTTHPSNPDDTFLALKQQVAAANSSMNATATASPTSKPMMRRGSVTGAMKDSNSHNKDLAKIPKIKPPKRDSSVIRVESKTRSSPTLSSNTVHDIGGAENISPKPTQQRTPRRSSSTGRRLTRSASNRPRRHKSSDGGITTTSPNKDEQRRSRPRRHKSTDGTTPTIATKETEPRRSGKRRDSSKSRKLSSSSSSFSKKSPPSSKMSSSSSRRSLLQRAQSDNHLLAGATTTTRHEGAPRPLQKKSTTRGSSSSLNKSSSSSSSNLNKSLSFISSKRKSSRTTGGSRSVCSSNDALNKSSMSQSAKRKSSRRGGVQRSSTIDGSSRSVGGDALNKSMSHLRGSSSSGKRKSRGLQRSVTLHGDSSSRSLMQTTKTIQEEEVEEEPTTTATTTTKSSSSSSNKKKTTTRPSRTAVLRAASAHNLMTDSHADKEKKKKRTPSLVSRLSGSRMRGSSYRSLNNSMSEFNHHTTPAPTPPPRSPFEVDTPVPCLLYTSPSPRD